MDIKEIRLANLLALAKKHGQDMDFCRRIGMNPSYLPQLKSKTKTIGDKIARRTEELLGLERGYMDVQHDEGTLPDKLPEADIMATAYSIETLPPALREQFKRLVFQMLAHINQGQSGQSTGIQSFDLTIKAADDASHPLPKISAK